MNTSLAVESLQDEAMLRTMGKVEDYRNWEALGLMSGTSGYLDTIESNPIFDSLVLMLRDKSTHSSFWHRFEELFWDEGDPEYAHPHDDALAIYIHAFGKVSLELSRKILDFLGKHPECHFRLGWATRVAVRLDAAIG